MTWHDLTALASRIEAEAAAAEAAAPIRDGMGEPEKAAVYAGCVLSTLAGTIRDCAAAGHAADLDGLSDLTNAFSAGQIGTRMAVPPTPASN